jgi:GNAT superfamily N-acetyltransferase
MLIILIIGFVCLANAVFNLPFQKLDGYFLLLFVFTIGIGSRMTLEIPRFKSHIAVSDTFIFLALLLYGGEIAIVLAAVEALCSSWRFCNKKITVFFNMAAMALSTTVVVLSLKSFGFYTESQLHGEGENFKNFFIALSVMALAQFISNTTIASIYGSLKSEKPFWETWKTKYAWTFITYSVGAFSAGVLLKAADTLGFGVVVASFPIIYFVYLTYRMYMQNVEMATAQAEPRLVCPELLFELKFPFPVQECKWDVRLADASELEQIAVAHDEVAFIESGSSPMQKDREGFLKRCLKRIEQKRTFVVFDNGKLVFKADIVAETSDVVYLEGIYVAPEYRGQGVGSSCLSNLSLQLMERVENICLLSNVEFKGAHRSFAKAGFQNTDCCQTIFV